MAVTTPQILRGLRAELSLNNPDYRAAGRMIAAALELLDARAPAEEAVLLGETVSLGPLPGRQPAPPEVRHAQPPEIRTRKAKR